MLKIISGLFVICCFAAAAMAQQSDLKIPAEVAPFVEKGTKAIALEKADINGDGRQDYILVLEKEKPQKMDQYDMPVDQRPLLILTRGAEGKLAIARRNERVVMCSDCGGVFGDPFEGVTVGRNTFTVEHYGGSAWRWKNSYKFNYSRIDKTWQLVRVEMLSYHTSDPDKIETKIYTPRNFGKIDINDFDPENFLNKKVKTAKK